jgi:polyhydroxyalkanoate synthesis regulator phasin
MRKKLIIATTAGVLTLGGMAVAVPALADSGNPAGSAVDRITEALSGLVSDGSITQEQADEVASTLDEAGIGHGGGHRGGGFDLSAAATALGMTEDELRTALEVDGTTLADVAGEQDVEVDALVDALVTAQQERIAAAVEDGRLTQEQADERLADLEERVTERVNSEAPVGGPGHGPRGDRGGRPGGDEAPGTAAD